MKLYDLKPSPNCKKVRVVAHELGIPLEHVFIDPAHGDNRTAAYLRLNAMGKVPTLDDDGFALWESGAILAYLASLRPASELLPLEPRAHADTLRWVLFTASHLSPYLNIMAEERRLAPAGRGDEHIAAYAQQAIARFLPILDGQLAGHEHLTGRYSIADIAAGCSLEVAGFVGLDLAPWPHLGSWLARLAARPAWQKATLR